MSERKDGSEGDVPEQGQMPQHQPQQGEGQGQQQSHQQPQSASDDGGLSRRQLLLVGGGAAGGVFVLTQLGSDSGGGTDSPEGPIRELFDIIDSVAEGSSVDDAVDRTREIYHENAPEDAESQASDLVEFQQIAESIQTEGGSIDFSLEDVEVVEQASAPEEDAVEEFALVSWTLTITASLDGQTDTEVNSETGVVAQNTAGEWKLWADDDELPV